MTKFEGEHKELTKTLELQNLEEKRLLEILSLKADYHKSEQNADRYNCHKAKLVVN